MESVLKATALTKSYGSVVALDNMNLELPQGKIIGLLGPNGSGKTTLIKLIAGILQPSSGSLTVCGNAIGPESKALVSYLPDRVYFNQSQKIIEILDYFQDFYADFDVTRARDMLHSLNIPLEVRFKSLSKGNREKVQLALVMSRRAKLYLLDEPIAGVDPAARDFILQTIVSNYDREATIIISTHLIADVEPVLDAYYFIHRGRIVNCGTVDSVREDSGKSLDELFREVFRCLRNY